MAGSVLATWVSRKRAVVHVDGTGPAQLPAGDGQDGLLHLHPARQTPDLTAARQAPMGAAWRLNCGGVPDVAA
jgi:hypothetical protein